MFRLDDAALGAYRGDKAAEAEERAAAEEAKRIEAENGPGQISVKNVKGIRALLRAAGDKAAARKAAEAE